MAAQFQARELTSDELEFWDRLVAGSPQATVFCSSRFSSAVAEATGRPYRFVAVFRGDRFIAGLPVFDRRKAGILIAQQPPLVPHLGLVVSAEVEAEHPRRREFNIFQACKALSDWFIKRYDYIYVSHHPGLTDLRPFTWQGWREKVCYTCRIRLETFSVDTLHSSIRKQVAKAKREGVQLEESEDLTALLKMVAMSYGRRGREVPFSEKYLETLFRKLCGQGLAHLYYAKDREGRVVSGRITLESFNVIYDWVAGADPTYYDSGATSYLLYSLIEKSKADHEIFDLMGANTPTIAVFKSNFGGQITPYYLTSKPGTIKGSLALFCLEILSHWRKT